MRMRNEKGAALVEFAVVLPVLALTLLGSMRFGLTMNNYVILTEAVRAGARQFALSRGNTSPYTHATGRVSTAAPNLTGGLVIKLYVDGAECTTNPGCQSALTTGYNNGASNPNLGLGAAKVTGTYPCSLSVFGINFAPGGCTLTSQMTERIE